MNISVKFIDEVNKVRETIKAGHENGIFTTFAASTLSRTLM